MATIVNYTGDGSTNTYAITFDYISRTDVVVKVNEVAAAHTFVNDTTVQITSTPANGAAITIQRTTPLAALVDFTDGSTLFETDLDLSDKQSRFLAEEARDRADSAITTLNTNIANINAVAGLSTQVTNVSGQISPTNNIATLAGISSEISNVSGISTAVSNVSNISSAVSTVAADATDIGVVSGISADVQTLADLQDGTTATNGLSTLAGLSSQITTVSSNNAALSSVASNISSVVTVSNDIASVIKVANDLNEAVSEVETVANDLNEAVSEIDTVANNITNVNLVGGQISPTNNIATLAGIQQDIQDVANIQSNISTIAASANTANVTTVANDLNGANNIGTTAGAITSINNVGNNINAVTTVSNNLTSVNAFGNQYVIGNTTPSSPNAGLLWFDTSTGVDTMKVYNGSSFQNAGSSVNGTSSRGSFTATAGQTTFTTTGYDSGYIDIWANGVKQIVGTDVTATNGTTFVFASGLAANDVVEYVAYGTFALADHYNKTNSDARYAVLGADVDFGSNKILYSNLYASPSDFPSASTYHGMVAHSHSNGKLAYAHNSQWLNVVNEDSSGNVTIDGNLTVNGSQTVINSTQLTVDDKVITVASGAADAAAANNSGIEIDGASASILYQSSGDKFLFNKDIETTGTVTGSNTTFDIVSANATVTKNTRNACDVSSSAFTMTLPSVAATGDFVEIRQIAGDFSVNNLTVAGNGNNINGDTSLTVDVAYAQLALVYNGTEWRVS